MRKRCNGQAPYVHPEPTAGTPSIELAFHPNTDGTQFTCWRVGSRADGYVRTVLAGGYLDVSVADLHGLNTRAVLLLLGTALSLPIPATDYRPGGLGCTGPPQRWHEEPIPGL